MESFYQYRKQAKTIIIRKFALFNIRKIPFKIFLYIFVGKIKPKTVDYDKESVVDVGHHPYMWPYVYIMFEQ